MGENMGPADVAAVVGNTDRNFGYPYPYGGGFGNGFGGDGSWIWFILILALFGGWGGNGNGGFGFGGFNNEYAWLSNGQKEIMQNTNNGFDTLQLSNEIDGVRDGIYGLSNQLCNTGNTITSAISNGFYNSEIAANNRQMANMQTSFDLSRQFADCCCENRLGLANLNSTILAENCADRALLQEGIRDVITASQNNTQRIIDEIFRDRLDEKDSKISDLQRQLQTAEQNAFIASNLNNEIDLMYNRLVNCPIPSTPVYRKNSDIYLQQRMWMRKFKFNLI